MTDDIVSGIFDDEEAENQLRNLIHNIQEANDERLE